MHHGRGGPGTHVRFIVIEMCDLGRERDETDTLRKHRLQVRVYVLALLLLNLSKYVLPCSGSSSSSISQRHNFINWMLVFT